MARYQEIYKPGVVHGTLIRQTESEDQFSMVMRNPSFFTKTALDVDFESTYIRLDETRWYSFTRVTRMQEIADYGQPAERRLAPDRGHGYIWRMSSFSQMEERTAGFTLKKNCWRSAGASLPRFSGLQGLSSGGWRESRRRRQSRKLELPWGPSPR